MSIHESIPQQVPEVQHNPADIQTYVKDFNVSIAQGNIPTYEGLMDANAIVNQLSEASFDKGNISATMFKHNAEPDRWILSEERYAENFRITRAKSLDELTPAQIKTAATLVKAKHAAPETHLEVIQSLAQKRMNLSERIYEAREEKQPTTKWVERQLIHEANGITAQSRKEQEHKNSREKTRKAFVAQYAPKLIAHMFSDKYEPGVEDGNFPVDQKKYEAIGIGDSEELISRAVALEFNKIVAGFDSQEAVKETNTVETVSEPEPNATTETKPDTSNGAKPTRHRTAKPAKIKPTITSAGEFADYIGRLSGYKVGKLPGETEPVDDKKQPVVRNAAEFTDYIEKLSGMRFSNLDNETQPDDTRNANEVESDKKYREYISRLAGFSVGKEDAPDEAKKDKIEIGKRLIKATRFTGKVALAATAVVMVQRYGINPLEHMVDHAGTVSDTVTPTMYGTDLLNR